MLDWATIEPALERFAVMAINDPSIPVVLAKQSGENERAERWVELSHGDEIPVVGSDEEIKTPTATGNTIAVKGLRDFMAHFRCVSIHQHPDGLAKAVTGRLRAAFYHRTLREILARECVSFVDAEPALELDGNVDGRVWSGSLLSVRLRAPYTFAPTNAEQPAVAAAEFEVCAKEPDGNEIQTEPELVTAT